MLASLGGCPIASENPVFGREDSVRVEGFDGSYVFFDPVDEKIDDEVVVLAAGGEIELVDPAACEKGRECRWKPIAIRLPAAENAYLIQVDVDDDSPSSYVFLERSGDYWMVCTEIEGRDERYDKQIRQTGIEAGLDIDSWKYTHHVVIGNPEPHLVLRFFDRVWSNIPRAVWRCTGLVAEGKTTAGFQDAWKAFVEGNTSAN